LAVEILFSVETAEMQPLQDRGKLEARSRKQKAGKKEEERRERPEDGNLASCLCPPLFDHLYSVFKERFSGSRKQGAGSFCSLPLVSCSTLLNS
jgi:hypothetical protein